MAAPALGPADRDTETAMDHLKSLIEELRIAAFCTGSGSMKDLTKAPIRRINDWSIVEF